MSAAQYNIFDLLQDIASNAEADRAGAWLRLAADDYPWLFQAITDNLDATPETVVAAVKRQNVVAGIMLAAVDQTQLHAFIHRLQEWFRENQ